MDANHPNMLTAIVSELTALQEEREVHVARIYEIDNKLGLIAKQLGVEIPSPALPLHRLPRVDKRVAGSMPERMMEILLAAGQPYTRRTLKEVLRDDPKFGPGLQKNENVFYNAVIRYLRTGKIVEVDGYLYHPERAPLPGGAEDPTGQHFPSNVSNLFAGREVQ